MQSKKIGLAVIIVLSVLNILLISIIHLKIRECRYLESKLSDAQLIYQDLIYDNKLALMNLGYKLKDIEISYNGEDSNAWLLSESISKPSLIIYIPFSEDLCSSCVRYAITKVENAYPSLVQNNRVQIITSNYNPLVKSRVYKINILYLSIENPKLNIPADRDEIEILPRYLIVNKDLIITSFFTPNSQYPERTDDYLQSVTNFLQNYE